MNLFFSVCSNNYLAQARILHNSIQKFHPGIPFLLFLCDKKIPGIHYSEIADEVIELETIEPRFEELALKYNIIELNTSLKPRIFEYLFVERQFDAALYLDPDIKVYQALYDLFMDLETKNILLTPHINSPIPIDGKKPGEESFLMFGIYNLGFIGLKNSEESIRFLTWWKTRTYETGSMDTYKGFFVDQLPVNYAPLFYDGVKILQDKGLNMAPWNLHERRLENKNGDWFVNGKEPLRFYHFSSFKTDPIELPQQHYNRFVLKDRPDLQSIYHEYAVELNEAGYDRYHALPNAYAEARRFFLKKQKRRKWIKKFLPAIFS